MKYGPPLLLAPLRHRLEFRDAADREEFHNDYPADEQESVRELHHRMTCIDAAPNPHRGSKLAAGAPWSAKRLEALHKEWRAAGRDWRALVNRARFPEAREPKLPAPFRDYLRAQFSGNQRANAPAYRQIIRQWERWLLTGDPRHALPGYVDAAGAPQCPPPGPQGRHPRGWSLKNLSRHAPPPAELELARIGVAAALTLLPKIPGTREGVRFLEYVSGDDVWLKRKCLVPGFGSVRVVQFGLMDYGASYYLDGFIQRPVLPRKDGSTEQLKRRDFLWCVALMLERYGYPLDYRMHLIVERGTATMSKAEARFLHEVSEGQIVTGWSTMEGEMVAAWEERKSGNSNAKGWHESFHNLYANEEADLPGQVGKDRDHSPAALQGRERRAQALNDVALLLSPEQRARLPLPFPTAQECYAQSLERVGLINDRKQHECEGFAHVLDWRPRGLRILPLAESELPAWLAANPRVNADNIDDAVEWFPRPETPRERLHRLSQGARFARLPAAVWRRFYEDLHVTETVAADLSIGFVCRQSGRKLRFEPATPDDTIKPGTKLTGFYRPDGSAIHLFAGNDRYLLTWPAVKAHRRADATAKQADFARKQAFVDRAVANVRADRRADIEQANADAWQIAQVLAEASLLEDEPAPDGEHALAIVNDAGTEVSRAVQAVTTGHRAAAREAQAVRAVDVVQDLLRRPAKPAPAPDPHDFF